MVTTNQNDGKSAKAAQATQATQPAAIDAIGSPSRLALALKPLGVAALGLLDSAREELAQALKDEVRALAADLLKPFAQPLYTLSASPAANVLAVDSEDSPLFYQPSPDGLKIKDGRLVSAPVRDLTVGMRLMKALQREDCAFSVKGGESIYVVTFAQLRAAQQAASLLSPDLLPDDVSHEAFSRAERLLRMAQQLGLIIPAAEAEAEAETEAQA